MKREKLHGCLISAGLAFLLSLGGVGCLVTGFDLDAGSMAGLVFACLFFAAASTACFQLKHGGTIILCLLALGAGFLWRSEKAMNQIMGLLYQISYRYNGAYGWGVLRFQVENLERMALGIPIRAIGCLVAACVSWTVCRRKTAIPGVLLSLLPLIACLVVTDTVPREGFLYILILGLIVLILTNNLRRHAPEQGISLTYMVTIPVAAALGLLFLAVPKEGYVNHTVELQQKILQWAENIPLLMEDISADHQNGPGSANASKVDLQEVGERIRYTYPVMDVVAAKSGTLYLREQDYDFYDGKGWTANVFRKEAFGRDPGGILQEEGLVSVRTRRGRDYLYLPYYPQTETELNGGKASNPGKSTGYDVTQWALPENWREMTLPDPDASGRIEFTGGGVQEDGGWHSRYLVLPNETKARAKKLLEQIQPANGTTTAMAEAIREYVRNSAEYDLDTPKMPTGREDFALWFLEESDTGYCVHFATASTVLLRAAGIRARYVTGYMTRAVAGEVVTVTAGDAHAWTEYYEPALGMWIPLDATPPDPDAPETTHSGGESQETTEGTEPRGTEETGSTRPEESTGPTTPTEGTTPGTPGREEPSGGASWLGTLAAVLFWMGAAVFTVTGQRQLRLKLRRNIPAKAGANGRALAKWREGELLYRVLKQTPPRELVSLAQKAKFSQHTLTAGELGQMDEQIRQARKACEERPWYLRLVYRYIFAAY